MRRSACGIRMAEMTQLINPLRHMFLTLTTPCHCALCLICAVFTPDTRSWDLEQVLMADSYDMSTFTKKKEEKIMRGRRPHHIFPKTRRDDDESFVPCLSAWPRERKDYPSMRRRRIIRCTRLLPLPVSPSLISSFIPRSRPFTVPERISASRHVTYPCASQPRPTQQTQPTRTLHSGNITPPIFFLQRRYIYVVL